MTKRDRIVAALRQMIRDGELPRGSRIQQDVLAAKFNTSITPVREALVLLEAEGLLVGEPNRGVSVADADFGAIKSVYIQRMLLETYAMQRATRRISHRDLDRAQLLLDRMEKTAGPADVVSIVELNRQFHFLFYDACGSEGLAGQIEQLWQRWPWDLLQVITHRPNASRREHRAMLEAVRVGDVARVANATQEHLRASYITLGQHLTGTAPDDAFDLDAD